MQSDEKYRIISEVMGYKKPVYYQEKCRFLFEGIALEGMRVLDVGCGPGELSLWAAIGGAEYVLGIEPESAGSSKGVLEKFNGLISKFGLNNCEANASFLEGLKNEKPFDIVILYNVVNHLNEDAVVKLHRDESARQQYRKHIDTISQLMNEEGILILADCSRSNFWNSLHLKSPLVPSIEWEKHQHPKTWLALFQERGFALMDVRWSPLNRSLLRRLTGNYLCSYLTSSHFVLRLQKTNLSVAFS